MTRVLALTLLAVAVWIPNCDTAQAGPPGEDGAAAAGIRLDNCLVSPVQEAQVPAQEAGVLAEIKVREGAVVRTGDVLAQIDDRRNQLEKQLAQAEYQAVLEKANNDINVRYAQAAANVADAEVRAAEEANRRVERSVSPAELRKLKLEHQRALLQIEQSALEQVITKYDAKASAAKVETADENVRRRRIVSPIDGMVVETRRNLGEWVQAGDVVAHVMRLDRLKVEGFVKESQYSVGQISGRNVLLEVKLPTGETRELTGKIVFVSPQLQTAGDYRIGAEVDNRQEGGQWLLRPGKTVSMRIE
jgi:multidrug efflux pump subunit AcrA (membrane-fusion protein)